VYTQTYVYYTRVSNELHIRTWNTRAYVYARLVRYERQTILKTPVTGWGEGGTSIRINRILRA